jgi:hypothetical protein
LWAAVIDSGAAGPRGGSEDMDSQMMRLALAVIIPPSMLVYSNSRITEAKETLRAEIAASRMQINAGLHRLEAKLTVHELEHRR